MKNYKLPRFYIAVILLFCLFHNVIAGESDAYPELKGQWTSLDADGQETEATITFEQDGKHLSGMFADYKDGQVIIEAPLIGYVDKQGGVIFDVQFGRVKSTNRLQLSSDQNALDGSFVNTMGNEGEVHLRRK